MYTPRWLLEILVSLLLQIVVNGWNLRYITGLLMPFKQMIEFQEIVWFISQELSTEHTHQMDQFIRIMGDSYGITQTVVNNNSEMRMIRSAARRNHMSIVLTTGQKDPIMNVVNKVLLGRHFYFITFMMMDKIEDMEPVYEICRFLGEYQYENSLLYFESMDGKNQLYGTSMYPVVQFENRTDVLAFFQRKSKQMLNAQDVQGYRFPTPLRQDPPHLFKVWENYEGSTYRIIETFVQHLNGSFKELEMPKDALGGQVVNMKQTLELVRQRRIEFSAHAYALFKSDEELDRSYPLLVVRWCLMVPLYNKVSTYLYAVQPFAGTVWFFVVGAFLALILLELLWLWLAADNAAASLIVALLNSFCYIINIATGRQLLQPSKLRFLLLLAVFFHGFFLSANYTSTLGSILTVNLFHAQLNTMEDLLQAQLPVMIIDYELEFLLQIYSDLSPEFRNLLRPVDSAIYAQHQIGFNNSYAYFVTEDKWQFLDEQQRHLKQRQFKFSDICFGSFHLAYPMQMDSSLWRDLEYYTYRVHSSGLHNYYAQISFESALRAGLVQRLSESQEYTSAGLQHLAIAFIFLLTMAAIAVVIFGLELFWTRILLSGRKISIV
ncbi:uncharacterized protein LOC117783035 [Drosophila innubila]|uniref:uncharacterized protein LOC117783035 n=1 Tax=Drosophila innubila TaxID=198719 RepID=UPI00148BD481|nr:uncharacterized protein LOC117783035 [Drosophila innubila]